MSGQQPSVLVGEEAMDKLIDIYMDGFVSGAASAVSTILGPGEPAVGAADRVADKVSDMLADALRADPLAVEEIRREISERLTGRDSGPKSFTLPNPHAAGGGS